MLGSCYLTHMLDICRPLRYAVFKETKYFNCGEDCKIKFITLYNASFKEHAVFFTIVMWILL